MKCPENVAANPLKNVTNEQKRNLNELFWDVLLHEVNGGDEKKMRAWVAQFATRNPKAFFKEFGRLQPKDIKVETTHNLKYIKFGVGKVSLPKKLPILTEGEGVNLGDSDVIDIN